MYNYYLLLPLLLLLACNEAVPDVPSFKGEVSDNIQLNQVGIYPGSQLRFSVVAWSALKDSLAPVLRLRSATTSAQKHQSLMRDADESQTEPGTAPAKPVAYYLTNLTGDSIVQEGALGSLQDWTSVGGVKAWYTEVPAPAPGEYRIYVPGTGYSHRFRVGEQVMREAFVGSIKSNYYQRAGMELLPAYAGTYARPAGHPDTLVLYHPSSGRAGKTSSPGGWYDAGDYNKYIVNAAFPLAQYLSLYEDVGDPLADGTLNIPESGNGQSDYLDELKYELDWMLTMQDTDGGLFHKLTTLNFEGMVMPHEATNQRYIVGKGTAATLDFAGAAAQAARVFRVYDEAYADRLLAAARRAWTWAEANPNIAFRNPPDVFTGQYGDRDFSAERTFAAAELYVTTGEDVFLAALRAAPIRVGYRAGASWNEFMGQLGVFTLLRYRRQVPEDVHADLSRRLIGVADSLVAVLDTTAFHQPVNRFVWGSNSDVLNAAMLLAAAYEQRPKPEYLAGIEASVDYIFGHNPLGVSFVTGYGGKTPMFIHHRPSVADGIEPPVPGLLSGGPNLGQQDRADTEYPANAAPMQSWADQTPSYASNEICLNWNAPLTYVLGWLEAKR